MRVLYGGRIHTQNLEKPVVSALAIESGRIIAIGSTEEILAIAPKHSEKNNLNGKTAWPGLVDAHIHLQEYATSLEKIDCETDDMKTCLERVHTRASLASSGSWILGHGWNQNNWNQGFGNFQDLDCVCSDHPVYLTAKSLHAAWVNSFALRCAGITSSTTDPEGGFIVRDNNGNPTGILLESAMQLVENAIPLPTDIEISQKIFSAQKSLWKMGITGVHDFDTEKCFTALQLLQEQGKLGLRVAKSIPAKSLPNAVKTGLRTGFGNDFLRIGPVKLFADGALGPRTASMLAPYSGETDYSGYLLLNTAQILEFGEFAVRNGFSLAIHAIGDRANQEVLNAFEKLRVYEMQHGLPHFRHRIEHVQILHPDDLERLSKAGIIASMQPIHATSDMEMADRDWGARSKFAYPWNSLLQCSTTLAFGSDAPVESPNPFWGLHAAVTRQRKNGLPGPEGWYPEQKISLQQALNAYTIGPAYASGMERNQGMLAKGFFADLIILTEDPFAIPPSSIFDIQPEATMVAGEWVEYS
jgi:predicted amidohydrolase YtcJ